MFTLLLIAILIHVSSSSNPHHRVNPKSLLVPWKKRSIRRSRVLEGGNPVLTTDVQLIEANLSTNVKVSYSGIEFTHSSDWIGMWPSETDLAIFSAPIKFKYVMPDPTPCLAETDQQGCLSLGSMCTWLPAPKSKCVPASPPSNGTVDFLVENMRTSVVFVYVSGNIQYPEPICQSKTVSFAKPSFPQGAHLAFGEGGEPSEMRLYWSAGKDSAKRPVVMYGTEPNKYEHKVNGQADAGRVYTKDDMCDKFVQPAGRQGWLPTPPTLLSATMTNLSPGTTVHYRYGDEESQLFSEDRSFVVPPAVGDPDRETVVAAFGDMGNVEADGGFHHSWDFNNKGEIPSLNTTKALQSDDLSEFVLHIGDISYAVGYMSEWDRFMTQIEPVASRRAWMTGIGNHEQGWSGSVPFPGTDSGGECGVPYNAHFPFASQDPLSKTKFSEREPWYSFVYGNVAFVQMSTEHDFSLGSKQNNWIRDTLKSIDRSKHPWIVFSGHRPMYIGSDWAGDEDTAVMLRDAVESLLVEFRVDVAIWGHFHSYEKFCDGIMNGTSCGTGPTQHFVIGTAGYDHSQCPVNGTKDFPEMSACVDDHWGYLRMHFLNSTNAKFEFIASESSAVLDVTEIYRSR